MNGSTEPQCQLQECSRERAGDHLESGQLCAERFQSSSRRNAIPAGLMKPYNDPVPAEAAMDAGEE